MLYCCEHCGSRYFGFLEAQFEMEKLCCACWLDEYVFGRPADRKRAYSEPIIIRSAGPRPSQACEDQTNER